MTSRQILWAALLLMAPAPVLEAIGGCGFTHGSIDYVKHNAVECECDFVGTGELRPRVQTDSDDAEEIGGTMDRTSNDLDLATKIVGIRFAHAGLPAGATIESAYVQFTGDATEGGTTTVTIEAEASSVSPTFSTADNDLSGRTAGSPTLAVTWNIPAWTNSSAEFAERTPELKALLQELVELPGWTTASPVVLRFSAGTGARTAESFDDVPNQAPQLVVTYSPLLTTTVPVCLEVTDPLTQRDAVGYLRPEVMEAQCNLVAETYSGLNQACGLPSMATCRVKNKLDPDEKDVRDSFQAAVCEQPCTGNEVDSPACSEYDPVAFSDCLGRGNSLSSCSDLYLSATHAGTDTPVCVASGSALAFHAFGRRSLCEVAGTSEVKAGDREPRRDPKTAGTVEIQGGPCPGGDCPVHPSFLLDLEPITFEVRWAFDPTFTDLGAAGSGLEAALLDDGLASFAPDSVEGTGTGRRGSDGLAVSSTNPDPLDVGVDWIGRTCNLIGTLGTGIGDDGVCQADGATVCRSDADCAAVGGSCTLPPTDAEQMTVMVALGGELVNQPPTADADADQSVECTSPDGATFTLNGRGSFDPEPNLALVSWRQGTRTGPEISTDYTVVQALGVGDSQSYVLRVIDAFAQLDEATTAVSVVDTTPPVVSCNAPATIRPPDALLSFGATATDVCDPDVTAAVTGYDCFAFTKKGKRISKLESCVVSFAGNTLSIHDVGGYGDHIQWTVEAPDDSGNVGEITCEVVVRK